MAHTIQDKPALQKRLRRLRGQTEALERALDADADCGAVLQQIAALRGAVNGLMAQVLEGHLRNHLGDPAASASQREDDLDAVLSVLRTYLK